MSEHRNYVDASPAELAATVKAAYEMGRADERKRIREALVQASPPVDFGMRYDGTEDPQASAYVEGWRDAWSTVTGVDQ